MNCEHVACHILAFSGCDNKPICLEELHGLLYFGNALNGVYNLEANYTMFSEHTIGFSNEDLEEMAEIYTKQGEDAMSERFNELFREILLERLL